MLDQNKVVREFNKRAYEEILKIVQVEIKKGQSIDQVIEPANQGPFKQNFAKALQGETTVSERNIIGPDGSDQLV